MTQLPPNQGDFYNHIQFDPIEENELSISCDDTSDDFVKETIPLTTKRNKKTKSKSNLDKSSGFCCVMTVLIGLTLFIIGFIVMLILIFLYLLFKDYI